MLVDLGDTAIERVPYPDKMPLDDTDLGGADFPRRIQFHRPPRSIPPFSSPGVRCPGPPAPHRIGHKFPLQPGHPLRDEARQGFRRLSNSCRGPNRPDRKVIKCLFWGSLPDQGM